MILVVRPDEKSDLVKFIKDVIDQVNDIKSSWNYVLRNEIGVYMIWNSVLRALRYAALVTEPEDKNYDNTPQKTQGLKH